MMPNLVETTTPLASNATFSTGTVVVSGGLSIVGTVFSDTDGTLFIEQTANGTDWDASSSYDVTAGDGSGFDEPLVANTIRIRFVNSGTNQTEFRLAANVRRADGNFAVAISGGTMPDGYFVIFEHEPNKWRHIPGPDGTVWEASSAADACGLAAISLGERIGHFVATDTTDMVSLEVTTQLTADFDPIAFP